MQIDFFESVSAETRQEVMPFLEQLQAYFSSLERVIQLLCYRILFLEQEEKVMKALALNHNKMMSTMNRQNSQRSINDMAIKTSRSKDNPLSDRTHHHQLNDEQILAVSNSQVSVRANQKQYKPSE